MLYVSRSDPVRDEIAFVDDENDLLVRFLFPDVFQNGLAERAHRVAPIEDVEDDVGRVNHFVELAVYPPRGALSVDGLDDICVSLEI